MYNVKKSLDKDQQGIALIETIAALGLAVIVLTSLVSLSVFTLRTSSRGQMLLDASKATSDQVELIRAYRDGSESWEAFTDDIDGCTAADPCYVVADTTGTTPSLDIEVGKLAPLDANGNSIYEVWFVPTIADDIVNIQVTATWNSGAEQKSTSIYTDITNWRNE